MSKNRVIVLKIISGELTITEAAALYNVSRRHLHRLVARFRSEGINGTEPRSRAPLSHPQQTTDRVRERVISIRTALIANGLDAGPITSYWRNQQREPGRWPGSRT